MRETFSNFCRNKDNQLVEFYQSICQEFDRKQEIKKQKQEQRQKEQQSKELENRGQGVGGVEKKKEGEVN